MYVFILFLKNTVFILNFRRCFNKFHSIKLSIMGCYNEIKTINLYIYSFPLMPYDFDIILTITLKGFTHRGKLITRCLAKQKVLLAFATYGTIALLGNLNC